MHDSHDEVKQQISAAQYVILYQTDVALHQAVVLYK